MSYFSSFLEKLQVISQPLNQLKLLAFLTILHLALSIFGGFVFFFVGYMDFGFLAILVAILVFNSARFLLDNKFSFDQKTVFSLSMGFYIFAHYFIGQELVNAQNTANFFQELELGARPNAQIIIIYYIVLYVLIHSFLSFGNILLLSYQNSKIESK